MNIATIRTIKPSDNIQLSKIIKDCFIEYNAPTCGTAFSDPSTDDLFNYFSQDGAAGYVAELDDEIVGCGGFFPTLALPEGYVELVKLYMHPIGRGKRIGYQLLKHIEREAITFGYSHIYLESLPAFKQALVLYEREGYVYRDTPLGISDHPTCDIYMEKKLVSI